MLSSRAFRVHLPKNDSLIEEMLPVKFLLVRQGDTSAKLRLRVAGTSWYTRQRIARSKR